MTHATFEYLVNKGIDLITLKIDETNCLNLACFDCFTCTYGTARDIIVGFEERCRYELSMIGFSDITYTSMIDTGNIEPLFTGKSLLDFE